MDHWLKHVALKNNVAGGARTYVVCKAGRVVGYYSLAAGSVTRKETGGRFRRNMPEPIPVVLLGRLAVDRRYQGKGIARGLMRDAALRVMGVAESVGIRGIVVHALNESARNFYKALGFDVSPLDAHTLFIALQDIQEVTQRIDR